MIYYFTIEITAEGPDPEGGSLSSAQTHKALYAAVDAAQAALAEHEHTIARTGYGVLPSKVVDE